jgi:hypothetical protein
MKMKFFLTLFAAVILATGCVGKQSGGKTYGVPLVKDNVEGRYERPLAEVYEAAKAVVRANGVLLNEITQHTATNTIVLGIEGRVQDRKVFMAVSEVDPNKVTSVIVQVRTTMGGRDLDLAHELEKQVALKLVR